MLPEFFATIQCSFSSFSTEFLRVYHHFQPGFSGFIIIFNRVSQGLSWFSTGFQPGLSWFSTGFLRVYHHFQPGFNRVYHHFQPGFSGFIIIFNRVSQGLSGFIMVFPIFHISKWSKQWPFLLIFPCHWIPEERLGEGGALGRSHGRGLRDLEPCGRRAGLGGLTLGSGHVRCGDVRLVAP